MGGQRKISACSNDEEYTPDCQGKRPYQRVTLKKRQKLIQLAVQKYVKVNRACKKVRVNNSNAKVIVRKEKAKRKLQNPSNNIEEVKTQAVQESQKEAQIQVKKEEYRDCQQNQILSWFPLGFPWFYIPLQYYI